MSFAIRVECHARCDGEPTPRRITFGERAIEVAELLDCWPAPDHRYFKFRGDDGALYIIRHDTAMNLWQLTLYDATGPVRKTIHPEQPSSTKS